MSVVASCPRVDAVIAEEAPWRHADLAPSEIITRLVALNAERAAEEAAGRVRWLRPDYQIPRFAKAPPPAAAVDDDATNRSQG